MLLLPEVESNFFPHWTLDLEQNEWQTMHNIEILNKRLGEPVYRFRDGLYVYRLSQSWSGAVQLFDRCKRIYTPPETARPELQQELSFKDFNSYDIPDFPGLLFVGIVPVPNPYWIVKAIMFPAGRGLSEPWFIGDGNIVVGKEEPKQCGDCRGFYLFVNFAKEVGNERRVPSRER